MSRRRSVPRGEVILAFIILIFVVIGAASFAFAGILSSKTSIGSTPSSPPTIKVQGTIDTVGWATAPVGIEFKDVNSDTRVSGAVFFSPNVPGQRVYEAIVLNQRTYTVTVTWVGVFGFRGTCTVGTLTVFTLVNSTITDNVKC